MMQNTKTAMKTFRLRPKSPRSTKLAGRIVALGGEVSTLEACSGGALGGAPTRTAHSETRKPNIREPSPQMSLAASYIALVVTPLGIWVTICVERGVLSQKTWLLMSSY